MERLFYILCVCVCVSDIKTTSKYKWMKLITKEENVHNVYNVRNIIYIYTHIVNVMIRSKRINIIMWLGDRWNQSNRLHGMGWKGTFSFGLVKIEIELNCELCMHCVTKSNSITHTQIWSPIQTPYANNE